MKNLPASEGQPLFYDAMKPLSFDVVSVQSQVVYGRVGNNVATPVLLRAGLEVAIVPTVVFSNTPHYPTIHGGCIPDDWFAGYLSDLKARRALSQLRAVLVGYLGGPSQTAMLAQWLRPLREQYPGLLVVVDPVIGDEDSGIYVAKGMVDGHLQHLIPQATGITPNGFELRYLTSMPVDTTDQVIAAARTLIRGNTQWIIATSAAPQDCPEDEIQLIVITADSAERIRHPRVVDSMVVKGTGDLFSATLTACLLAGKSLNEAARFSADVVAQALKYTHEAESAELLLPREWGVPSFQK